MTGWLKNNMHPLDRVIRAAVGLCLLSLTVIGPATPLGYIGFVPLLTAIVGTCPLYTIFGFSTCSVKAK